MSTTAAVSKSVERFPSGQVFGYGDIAAYQAAPAAVVKAMSRLVQGGEIKRLSRGRFYRPKQGVLGELKPSDNELLKTILYKNGRRRGYLTGVALYNKMGLTTQVPQTITVATDGGRQVKDFGTIRAKLIKSRAPVRESDILYLQYLDVLRGINEIPDTDVNKVLASMAKRFSQLDKKQIKRTKKLALNYYSAKVAALTGLLVEKVYKETALELKKSLNPLTRYKIGLDKEQWPASQDWNIQ